MVSADTAAQCKNSANRNRRLGNTPPSLTRPSPRGPKWPPPFPMCGRCGDASERNRTAAMARVSRPAPHTPGVLLRAEGLSTPPRLTELALAQSGAKRRLGPSQTCRKFRGSPLSANPVAPYMPHNLLPIGTSNVEQLVCHTCANCTNGARISHRRRDMERRIGHSGYFAKLTSPNG